MLIQQQQQYKIENEQRKTENKERLRDLEEERDGLKSENAELSRILEQEQEFYRKENKNRKREHAEVLHKLSEERNNYQRENVRQKTEQEQLVATEIKSMREEVRVEIDTMRDSFTQLIQRQSHHSESPPKNDHRQADIVPPDITEIPTTKKQKMTTETNTKTNRWMRFLESPPTKLLLNPDYLKRYQSEQKKGTQGHFNDCKRPIDNTANNKYGDRPS